MANLTPQEFQRVLKRVRQVLSEARAVAEIAGIKQAEAIIKRRVFNDGRASDGSPLGQYSAAYARYRANRGRQVGYKDLEFTGDLRRDLVTGTNNGNAVLGFLTDRGRIIAAAQEVQVGKKIWTPSDAELDEIEKAMVKAVIKFVRRELQQI